MSWKAPKDASFQALSPLDYEKNKLRETQPLSKWGPYAESCESALISAALLNLAPRYSGSLQVPLISGGRTKDPRNKVIEKYVKNPFIVNNRIQDDSKLL